MPGKKRFQYAIPACTLLRENFHNSVPSQKYLCLSVLIAL
jgi:hypothetical protein